MPPDTLDQSIHANITSYSHSTTCTGDTGLRGSVGEAGVPGPKGDQGANVSALTYVTMIAYYEPFLFNRTHWTNW